MVRYDLLTRANKAPQPLTLFDRHYILTGPPGTPYEDGQYWGTLVFPPDYPFAPPAIRMHTPSGRFRCSERLCLSISDFHPKSFNPAWEVSTILLGVLSFMTSEEMTTGSLSASDGERRVLAARSRWWNSTGGGSTDRRITGQTPSSSGRGFDSIKAGDGGQRFREQWPEQDEANWKWVEDNRIEPTTGNSLAARRSSDTPGFSALRRRAGGGASESGALPKEAKEHLEQGWARRNAWYLGIGCLFLGAVINRLYHEQS